VKGFFPVASVLDVFATYVGSIRQRERKNNVSLCFVGLVHSYGIFCVCGAVRLLGRRGQSKTKPSGTAVSSIVCSPCWRQVAWRITYAWLSSPRLCSTSSCLALAESHMCREGSLQGKGQRTGGFLRRLATASPMSYHIPPNYIDQMERRKEEEVGDD
jgi:hypothetical protein